MKSCPDQTDVVINQNFRLETPLKDWMRIVLVYARNAVMISPRRDFLSILWPTFARIAWNGGKALHAQGGCHPTAIMKLAHVLE